LLEGASRRSSRFQSGANAPCDHRAAWRLQPQQTIDAADLRAEVRIGLERERARKRQVDPQVFGHFGGPRSQHGAARPEEHRLADVERGAAWSARGGAAAALSRRRGSDGADSDARSDAAASADAALDEAAAAAASGGGDTSVASRSMVGGGRFERPESGGSEGSSGFSSSIPNGSSSGFH